MDESLFQDLAEKITKHQAGAVVGAGVTVASSGNAQAASWTGLLRLGIERCMAVAHPRPSED
jgi:hypothetical protein